MITEEEKSLQQLREIFFAERDDRQEEFEKELESIKFRLNNKDAKVEAYYPIVTEILQRKIDSSEDEVAEVFYPILGKALKKQIEESKDDIIDALYPIMGETIKKTVAEAVKEMYNNLNAKIDNALRKGIFSKQVKSTISGVSTNDLILKESFPFSVNEVFLIHEESGLLISHTSSPESNMSDADLVSGMLTAIKDFVKESFKTDSGAQNLYEIQYGESKIMIERGRYSYLAIVVKGQEPTEFDTHLEELNNDIHKEYSKKLREFDGDISGFESIKNYLSDFIDKFSQKLQEIEDYEPKPILKYLLLGLLSIALLIWGAFTIPQYFKDKSIKEQLTEKLSKVENLNLDEIKISSENNNLSIIGFVKSFEQKAIVDSIVNTISKVDSVNDDLSVLFLPSNEKVINEKIEEILLRNKIKQISYLIEKDRVTLNGLTKSNAEKILISDEISRIDGVRLVINNLEINKIDYKSIVERTIISFNYGQVELEDVQKKELNKIYNILINQQFKIKIIGISDGTQNSKNLEVAKKRAEIVKNYFVGLGLSSELISTEGEINNERIAKFKVLGED